MQAAQASRFHLFSFYYKQVTKDGRSGGEDVALATMEPDFVVSCSDPDLVKFCLNFLERCVLRFPG